MKKIFYYLFALSFVSLTSCSDDEPNDSPLDPSIPIYQEYEVDFYDNGMMNVFASFRKNNGSGESVKLNNGASISVNGSGLSYFRASDYADYGVIYDYSASLTPAEEVEFKFTRGEGAVYTNSVSKSAITPVSIPDELGVIANDKEVDLGENNFEPEEELTIRLVPLTGTQTVYEGKILLGERLTFTVSDVPLGMYSLQVMNCREIRTTQNDRTAGGLIKVYYLDSKQIRVGNESELD